MWTPEEAEQVIAIAREIVPDVKTMSMPKDRQAEEGIDNVTEDAKAYSPTIIE